MVYFKVKYPFFGALITGESLTVKALLRLPHLQLQWLRRPDPGAAPVASKQKPVIFHRPKDFFHPTKIYQDST